MHFSCYLVLATQRSLASRACTIPKGITRYSRKMKLLLLYLSITILGAHPSPGLLRVPKVYNALITTNQNLSPSRAFPVIQPVVHRTAIGYVPPFYYTQIAPHYTGPEVSHVHQSTARGSTGNAEPDVGISSNENLPSETSDTTKQGPSSSQQFEDSNRKDVTAEGRTKNGGQVPLSFYPNYHSLYYDPYFYSYTGYNPHLPPSTYYIDYQPHRPLAPLPPQDSYSEHLLPSLPDEKAERKKEEKEKIPDVPPPPLPTAGSKRS